jgi:muramoyltetrapeptide carboxypeptidase
MRMPEEKIRIGIVAPACRFEPALAEAVTELACKEYGERISLRVHPQCFLSAGHFAGEDDVRARAFLEYANDETLDAIWIARGGYGSGRIIPQMIDGINEAGRRKTYLGYSDAAALLGAMYARGFASLFHGPMPADIQRRNGKEAVLRGLSFLVERSADALEPSISTQSVTAAFNITLLEGLIGTPYEPDLSGHVLMLEEVSEEIYRIDRSLMHLTRSPSVQRVAGIRLGRCGAIPENDPDFGQDEVQVVTHWCEESGIPYLGRADIGHDVANKVVPFGRLAG